VTNADSGQGPPIGRAGWIRTGNVGATSGAVGFPNCNAWQNGVSGTGTVAELDGAQPTNDTVVATEHGWEVLATFCDSTRPVWCVEDD
jgi:hypothetical protein